MNENRVKRNKLLGERIVKGLESRNMEGYYAESKEEALKKALQWIPEGSSVAWVHWPEAGDLRRRLPGI